MLTGLNHLTLAVSNLASSLNFYTQTLGFIPKAAWDHGAYLSLGNSGSVSLWIPSLLEMITHTMHSLLLVKNLMRSLSD